MLKSKVSAQEKATRSDVDGPLSQRPDLPFPYCAHQLAETYKWTMAKIVSDFHEEFDFLCVFTRLLQLRL